MLPTDDPEAVLVRDMILSRADEWAQKNGVGDPVLVEAFIQAGGLIMARNNPPVDMIDDCIKAMVESMCHALSALGPYQIVVERLQIAVVNK